MSGELFAPEEVAMDSPRLAWMKRHGIITWYDNGRRNGVAWCPPQWFAGFQVWLPLENGFCFFALETGQFGDSRIGEGESEDDALAALMTCGEARGRGLRLWNEEAS